MRRLCTGLIALLALAVFGCGDKAAPSSGSKGSTDSDDDTPSSPSSSASTDDASAPSGQRFEGSDLVDDDYRIRIHPPDPSYSVWSREDTEELGHDAIASITDSMSNTLYVFVTETPDVDLASLTTGLALQQRAQGAIVDAVADVPFQGISAKRISTAAMGRRLCDVFFKRDRFVYEVKVELSAGFGPNVTCDVAMKLYEAVKLEPGPVAGWRAKGRPRDQNESAFRVRDGVYESPLSGLRLPIPAGCKLLSKRQAELSFPGAEIVIMHAKPEWGLMVRSDVWLDVPDRAMVVEQVRQGMAQAFGGTVLPETTTWTVLGKSERVTRFVNQVRDYEMATIIEGDRGITLTGFTAHANAKESFEQMQRALEAMTRMSEADRAALAEDLAQVEPTKVSLDAWSTLRGSTYTHHGAGLAWTLPKGPWLWSIGATAANNQALPRDFSFFTGNQRESGVALSIMAFPAGTTDELVAHSATLDTYGPKVAFGHARKGTLGTLPAWVSDAKSGPLTYRFASVVRHGFLYVLSMSAPSEAAFAELESGMRAIEPEKSFYAIRDGRFVDLGTGITVTIEPTWVVVPLVEGEGRGIGATFVSSSFELYALPKLPWIVRDQLAAAAVSGLLQKRGIRVEPAPPAITKGTLAGLPARRFTFRVQGSSVTTEALLADRDDLIYILVAQGPGTLDAVNARMTLAPR